MILSEVLLDIDNVDHLTILYRKGKEFDKREAKRLIIDYRARYALPREVCALTPEELDEAGLDLLYAELVKLRTAMMKKAGY